MGNTSVTNQEILNAVGGKNGSNSFRNGNDVIFSKDHKFVNLGNNRGVLIPENIPFHIDTIEPMRLEPGASQIVLQRAIMSTVALSLEEMNRLPK